MKSCPFCKNNIEDDALYCPHCGNDVTVGDSIQECNHFIISWPDIPNIYQNKIKARIWNIVIYASAFLLGIYIADKCDSDKSETSNTTVQMPVNNKPDSILKKDSVFDDRTVKIDSSKIKRIYDKMNEMTPKERELVVVNGNDSLYAELLEADPHTYNLYLASTDGGFYLNKMADADFEYVTQYTVIGDNVHFVAGKDGYGRGMTNYYYIFNTTIWNLKKIAEGHYIKFEENQVIVIDFDGNKTYYDLL